MWNIIKSDLYRIVRSKAIYIMTFLLLALDIVSVLEPTVPSFTSLVRNSNLYYIFIFVVFTFLTVDFSNRTLKNSISSNCSRLTYFLSKTLSMYLTSIIYFIVHSVFSYLLDLLKNGRTEYNIQDYTIIVLMQLTVILGAFGFMIMVAFLTKDAVAFNIIAIATPTVLNIVLSVIYSLPEADAENFMSVFSYEMSVAMIYMTSAVADDQNIKCMLIYLAAAIILPCISYLHFRKCEIK